MIPWCGDSEWRLKVDAGVAGVVHQCDAFRPRKVAHPVRRLIRHGTSTSWLRRAPEAPLHGLQCMCPCQAESGGSVATESRVHAIMGRWMCVFMSHAVGYRPPRSSAFADAGIRASS